jgi:uncharacterized protein (TIGR02118 family)
MIKIVFCLHRLPHLSRAQFQDYWRKQHAPLVARLAGELGIVRYVQSHTLDEATFAQLAAVRGAPPAYDGVAQLWVDETAAGGSAEARARAALALLEDEKQFIDLPRSPIFRSIEQEIL